MDLEIPVASSQPSEEFGINDSKLRSGEQVDLEMTAASSEPSRELKVTVLGAEGVGKTNWILEAIGKAPKEVRTTNRMITPYLTAS